MPTEQVQVLQGHVSSLIADVYLRRPEGATWEHAEVKGPYCSNGKTLPTTTPFEAQRQGDLWRARIIDPVGWSIDHPALYRVRIETVGGDLQRESIELECGIRQFGCKNGNLWLDGKRWVMRGAWRHHVLGNEIGQWAHARMAMWVQRPDSALLTEAARHGVMLAIEVEEDATHDDWIAMTRCPAVSLVIVGDMADVDRLRSLFPNTLLGKRYAAQTISSPPQDADVVILPVDDRIPAELDVFGARPVLAERTLADPVEISLARASCDQLQRDLANRFDLSGYIV